MENIREGLHEAECLLNDRVPKRFNGKALKAVTSAADLIEKQQQQIEELQERIAIMEEGRLPKKAVPSVGIDVSGVWACCPGCGYKIKPLFSSESATLLYFPDQCKECGQGIEWNDPSERGDYDES